jgi:alanine racemase
MTNNFDENDMYSVNRITINTAALRHNYRLVAANLPAGVRLLAMVKGDGYGHGMVEAARAFAEAGCGVFGVAELCEGIQLRKSGVEGDIFVMVGFQPEHAELFFTFNLVPVVFSREAVQALSETAVRLQREIGVHLKIDCGMSRLGVLPGEIEEFTDLILALPGISLAGVLSHFPEADNPRSPGTARAFAIYSEALSRIENRFSGLRHIANSGAVLNFPETLCNMVRAGIALYGYSPDGIRENSRVGDSYLRPAMTFATRIAMVKEVPPGTGISYGRTYITTRQTRLAVLPVGYEDGYPRALSSVAEVLIHGHRAPILGRVCMNLCMADITEIEGVRAGDEAVLLGEQGGEVITADDIAAWAGTISYEILCMLGNNNERVHVEYDS